MNVLSVSKKHEDLSQRESPVECHQSWKVIFPHSLGNGEFTADTCEYKDQGNALNNTSYIRKNTKFSLDAKLVSALILKNPSVILC